MLVQVSRVLEVAGPKWCQGFAAGRERSSHVFGAMKSRGVPAPADRYKVVDRYRWKSEEREGCAPLDRPLPAACDGLGADTAVSIEREVVSGHAYAILAPEVRTLGWCGNDKPTLLSVDGVRPATLGPRRFQAPGPS
ncbi:hypothetical protein Are01nite_74100 [Actinoplanes regularis]|nr:hypothetical protein Are01nite_74100 [Actinoplanes regularis]